ncbi:cytochrome P450 [Myceligenerans salitolerans]|uniref:Cytochrome P450 n=1 Tax=Myceligenerans salitolerans TaxID=1230528 RepID=A0ABS3IDW5_9MICO|nr:cytochrome P450 [Myceligenerans salitolerans]MBO0611241.1 cytochrome P450 [Myceligenerans salitolerans]
MTLQPTSPAGVEHAGPAATGDGPLALGAGATARVLWALTRHDRVDRLVDQVESHPHGVLLRTPFGAMLITATPSATKHVLVTNAAAYEKGLGQSHARQIIGDGLLTAEGDHWRRQRRDASRPLRAKEVEGHAAAIAGHADRSVRRLCSAEPPSLPIALTAYTLDCLAETMGFPSPSAEDIHEAFDAVQDEAIFRSIVQGLVPIALRPRSNRRVRAALRTLSAASATALSGLRRKEAWARPEGMISLFLAGYETTSSTLTWASTFLAARPGLQETLRAEAERVFAGETPTAAHVGELEWANAVFKETLRLRPPVWLISRRAVAADVVDGVELAPGDEVLILPGAVGRRVESPDEFRAERHLDARAGVPSLAFGAGPRACPGGALAQTEAVIWLATAARHLFLEFRPGVPTTPNARMSQSPLEPLPVTAVPRGGADAR